MKKLFLILFSLVIFSPTTFAQEDIIALLSKKGFFEKPQITFLKPEEQVKRTLCNHLKYANSRDMENLKALYSERYTNSDGLNKDVFFDLIQKTWSSYPDICYKIYIKNIDANDHLATAEITEYATATTDSKSGILAEKGSLESVSNSVYYLEKINDEWEITSDHILSEKTFLKYGSAKDMNIELYAPAQIAANTQYTTSLKINPPKDSLIIASIGREKITYPQTVAEEVFRKLPDDGVLERIFTSNNKNINEYAVASFGITKAELNKGTEVKIYVTGLGFGMTRINVIPKNEFIKAVKDEKKK